MSYDEVALLLMLIDSFMNTSNDMSDAKLHW